MKPGKVYIKTVASKRYLQLAWLDPATGTERRRSAGTRRLRDAESAAHELERSLYRGVPIHGLAWETFCQRYEAEHTSRLRRKSRGDWLTVKASISAAIEPTSIQSLTPSAISEYSAALFASGKPDETIGRYLRTLRAALKWAANLRLIHEAPHISIPRKARQRRMMKGRPITTEEFERMLTHTHEIVGEKYAPSWQHLLRVLWLSGLRLGEIPELYWDRPEKLCIHHLDRHQPMMRIHAELEKGGQDRMVPLPPDFAELLRETPENQRTGHVCKPLTRRGLTTSDITISRTVSLIGRKAGVVVNTNAKTDQKKFASCHDLRRSFGSRWALMVEAPVLQQLMRHKSLSTTMHYYIEIRATDMGEAINRAFRASAGDSPGDPKSKTAKSGGRQNP